MKISFIGFGNMAKAIADGLLCDANYELRAASPSLPLYIPPHGIKTYPDNLAVVADADIIILAVKPAMMREVVAQMSSRLPSQCLVISIAAGIGLSWFTDYIPGTAVVRAMPNIAAAIGKAATPLIANQHTTLEQKKWAEHIFTQIGLTTWADKEADIDAFTALSGSGPAYIFKFMEAMIHAACDLGITDDIAKSFTLQTFQGALSLASENQLSLGELRKKVTSPGGTTAAAVEVLTQRGFDELIHAAMKAAYDRAQQLGSQNR